MSEKKDVRHGCVDCTHYPLPNGKEPCKSCDYYSNWEDKREMKKIMLEIDCRNCCNRDMANDRCKLYGADPDKAVAKCAADAFKGYWPKSEEAEK